MKKSLKLFGIIAIVAIIGLLAACGGGDDTSSQHEHQWGNWTVTTAANCSATGTGSRVCTVCGETDPNTTIPIDPTAHDCTNWTQTTAPTCTTAGIETGTCTRNATHTPTRTGAAALGHDYEWVVTTPATDTTEGIETKTCKRDPTHTDGTRKIVLFTTIANFATWLSTQPTNTASTPYSVKLNVSSLVGNSQTAGSVGKLLNDNSTKFVSIDISGSTFTGIVAQAFYGCTSLTSITISNSVTGIGSDAFKGCTSLSSITIPFVGNTLNGTTYTFFGFIFGSSAPSSPNYTQSIPASLKTVIITGGNSIPNNAFYGCAGLTSITIPDSVTSIGSNAFSDCSLTSITIPNNVTNIGSGAFAGCDGLTSITIPNNVTNIGSGAFASCGGLASIIIPNSVTSIGGNAFISCTSLTSVTIGNGVTSIGSNAFDHCTSLTSVTFNATSKVTSIGDYAFYDCTKLASITIPNSVTSIGSFAFFECTSLTSVTIPNSVTSIGSSAFESCTNLTSVKFEGTIPSSGFSSGAFGVSYYLGYLGDLREKFYATDPTNGTPGTYTRPNTYSEVWTKTSN